MKPVFARLVVFCALALSVAQLPAEGQVAIPYGLVGSPPPGAKVHGMRVGHGHVHNASSRREQMRQAHRHGQHRHKSTHALLAFASPTSWMTSAGNHRPSAISPRGSHSLGVPSPLIPGHFKLFDASPPPEGGFTGNPPSTSLRGVNGVEPSRRPLVPEFSPGFKIREPQVEASPQPSPNRHSRFLGNP